MEAVVTTIIGLVGGLVLAVAFWYWTVHVIRPSVEFSENLSKITTASGEILYRLKIRNTSRRRGVIDLTFGVSIRYPDRAIRPDAGADSIKSFGVDSRTSGIYRLGPRRSRLIVLDITSTLDRNRDRGIIAALYPVESQRLGLDLEALLRRSEGAHLIVRMLAYDQWSGARRYFESKHFSADDIKQGYFQGMDVP